MGDLLAHLAEKAQRVDVHISGLIRPRGFTEFSGFHLFIPLFSHSVPVFRGICVLVSSDPPETIPVAHLHLQGSASIPMRSRRTSIGHLTCLLQKDFRRMASPVTCLPTKSTWPLSGGSTIHLRTIKVPL